MPEAKSSQKAFRPVSIDLEVNKHDGRIRAFAAIRPDADRPPLTFPAARRGLLWSLADLDDLARGSDFLLGHNIIVFDIPHLRAENPALRLLDIPVVDTLRLNPLAFPQNPYHRLVKHYQDGRIVQGKLNDPELDARLTLELFGDQLKALGEAHPDLLTSWHWLATLEGEEGFDQVFSIITGAPRPSDNEARRAILARLESATCQSASRQIVSDPSGYGWELSYALAWLSVAGGNSVTPPWVKHEFPKTMELIRRLRDTACPEPDCGYCRERHDARKELARWFGFDDFRSEPKDSQGRSYQRLITEAAMARRHVLGILPTGAGKSVCYQLPALSRYDKTGALTVVISPLVALMSDQVAGLRARGIESCVSVNSQMSMPERADALERIRLGDASILLISPEQLRSDSIRRALSQRHIGCWVLDEAHCLSRWGHDFRPDYRYIGRFIRERSHDEAPPLICLTATAKPEVIDEITDYFRAELDIEMRVLDAGAQRAGLEFVVARTSEAEKFTDILHILRSDLPEDTSGGAIVYCSTRRQSEELAEFLSAQGTSASHFHAGLAPETKKETQQNFIKGELRVIVATNAFGMGIDKPDVRLVIHADIPGSLENYLQEAGRAGRDQRGAKCVLLYTLDDVERQFGMSARSRLSRREIHAVLRALRQMDAKKRMNGVVVATTGEILSEEWEQEFHRDSATDDTRMKTAVAWLEEAQLISREQNEVKVYPSSLRIASLSEARKRLERKGIQESYRKNLISIVKTMMEADPDEGISTDELMAVSGLSPENTRKALNDLERLGIAQNDTAITAFVHSGVQNNSQKRFQKARGLEESLIELLREEEPDAEKGETYPLNIQPANQRLKDRGLGYSLPQSLRSIIRSVAADGRGEEGSGGSLTLRWQNREIAWIKLLREWKDIAKAAELRRAAAQKLLEHLLSTLPAKSRGTDLLAETTLGKLLGAVRSDPILNSQVKAPEKLTERALMWLHEQEVIKLHKGMTIFRPAMTIQLSQERRGFAASDFESLKIHYDEQTLQIHVMAQYATTGLESTADAIRLAMDYFSMNRKDFLRRWLPMTKKETALQTTPESWRTIVDSLDNPRQRRIVADSRESSNALILAGPGSGKTRALVHRIAYLIRVRREDPRSILALAYNRHAAVEIRKRLEALIGEDARGVLAMTCHALAMKLVGASFSGRSSALDDSDFQDVMQEAISLLGGGDIQTDESDETRARLLSGFRWILVDEYQDIGKDQYTLISALSGRSVREQDDRLNLLAVGDDDQNIYAFNGSSVEFIRKFERDYSAKPAYLTENYRSTANIISASNAVIAPASSRMKADRPIEIDRKRAKHPPGGAWSRLDPVSRGKVQILPAGTDAVSQAQAAIAELKRLASLTKNWDWSKCAIAARQWSYLDPVRSLCEIEDIPCQIGREESIDVWRLRETRALIEWLKKENPQTIALSALENWLSAQPKGPWIELLSEAVETYRLEESEAETPTDYFIEWLAEWSRQARRRQRGLLLTTAHGAKGLEFDHMVVLDGGWRQLNRDEDTDAPRRLYYVAMTRAKKNLTLMRLGEENPFLNSLSELSSVTLRNAAALPKPDPRLRRTYRRLSLSDIFLSFAGYRAPYHLSQRAIAALSPEDRLQIRVKSEPCEPERWELLDAKGTAVGRLAKNFRPPEDARCIGATVLAIVRWDKDSSQIEYRNKLKSDSWEAVVPELIFEPNESRRRFPHNG